MTILFAGGEMGAFIPSDSTATEYTSGAPYDPDFARCGLRAHGTLSYDESASWTGAADIWLHGEIVHGGISASAQGSAVLIDGSGTERFRIATSSSGLHLQYNIGAGWVDFGTPVNVQLANLRQTIDVHIVMNSASGSGALYLAGTKRIEGTGVNLSTIASVTKMRFYGNAPVIEGTQIGSQFIVADESTIGWRLKTVPPTGAGANTTWIGTYAEVDEIVYQDGDFVNSATAAEVELFTHSTTIPSGYSVRGIAVTARAKCGSGGPQNLQLALRSGGTNYFSGSKLLDAGYGAFVHIWEDDPATAAEFTTSAVGLAQFGVKSVT